MNQTNHNLLRKLSRLLSIALVFTVISCSDNSTSPDPEPEPEPENQYFTMGIGAGGGNYLLTSDELLTGEISPEGNGLEVGAGRDLLSEGRYIYDFDRNTKNFIQYEMIEDGTIQEVATILGTEYVADRANSKNKLDENTLLYLDPVQWGEPEVKWVRISIPEFTVHSSGSFNLPTIAQTEDVNWQVNVGRATVHGDKLVMGTVYYDLDGNYLEDAHAIVLDYPGMTNPALIETDKLNAELGITSDANYVHTDNGDLYIKASGGNFWGKPGTEDQPGGGILRIKAGETDFDDSYFLDLTEVLGEPTNIMHLNYVSGNTAIAMLFNPSEMDWSNYEGDHYYYAKINLETQEVTPYDVPTSGSRLSRYPLVHDGMFYTFLKSAANSTTHVLRIDTEGGPDAYTVGARLVGENIIGYSIFAHPTE